MRRQMIGALAIAALTVAAVVGVGPAASAAPAPPPNPVYVALGDSEAAGTGNLPYVDEDCLRSAKSYPMLLGAQIGGVASSACAGATTADVAPGQFADLGAQTQLVTLTVGANDIGWQGVLVACSSAGTPQACNQALTMAQVAIQGLAVSIGTTVAAIRLAAPNARIVVTGYPYLFGQVTDSCSVGAYMGTPVKVTAAQAQLVNFGIQAVNTSIAAGVGGYASMAGDPYASYLDVTAGFAGHALCDSGDRWISGLVSGKQTFDRSFHVNSAGSQAYASIIWAAIAP